MKIDEVSIQVRGLSYKKKDSSSLFSEASIPVLRAGNIKNGKILLQDLVYVPKNIVKEKQYLKAGDVLIAASSGSKDIVGKAAMIDFDMSSTFGAFCKVIRPNSKLVYNNYFKYFFETQYYKRTIKALAEGANINNLKNEHLDKLEIPLPPLPEQKRIAAILDAADALRQKDQQLIDHYNQLSQSLFLDMFGDPVVNNKKWKLEKIDRLFFTSSGGTPSKKINEFWEDGEIPWIGSNLCKDEIIYKTDGKYITNLGLEKSSAKLLLPNTIIVALVGATIGKVGLLKVETTTNQNVAALVIKNNESINELFAFFTMKNLYSKFMVLGKGKFKMANLGFIRNLDFIVPPVHEQRLFAEQVQKIEILKNLAESNLKKSNNLFNCLLQMAFSGELRHHE